MHKQSSLIVTWQPALTDHKSYTFSALAQLSGQRLEANVLFEQHPERAIEGWTTAVLENIDLHVHRGPFVLLSLLRRLLQTRHEVHMFCSPWERGSLILCLFVCAMMGCRYYLISEPYSVSAAPYFGAAPTLVSRFKKSFRPLIYQIYSRMIRNSVGSIFAISDLSGQQYVTSGIDPARVVPFGYYVPPDADAPHVKAWRGDPDILRVAFVGTLNLRKGIDTLVQACRILDGLHVAVEVHLFGKGDLSLLDDAPPNVSYQGRIPFGQTQTKLAEYDAMILLSRHDGWGVVVNEALLAGTPVICTDAVGASRIIRDHNAGIVVPAEDPAEAAAAIERLARDPLQRRDLEMNARQARESILPKRGAEIILKAIQAQQPVTK